MEDPDKGEINHIRDRKEEAGNTPLPMKLTSLDAIGEYVKSPNSIRDFLEVSICLMKKIPSSSTRDSIYLLKTTLSVKSILKISGITSPNKFSSPEAEGEETGITNIDVNPEVDQYDPAPTKSKRMTTESPPATNSEANQRKNLLSSSPLLGMKGTNKKES